MNQSDVILACFAATGGKTLTPVQMQKLLFLVEKRMPSAIGGPVFDFKPYDYGPFDPHVYTELESLQRLQQVEILSDSNLRWKKYRPLPSALTRGDQILKSLGKDSAAYLKALGDYVTSLSFPELVGAIYKAYPEMKVKSVFKG